MNPANKLRQIQREMSNLLYEADRLIRHNDSGGIYSRAKVYCLAQIEQALEKVNPYDICTLDDVINHFDTVNTQCEYCGLEDTHDETCNLYQCDDCAAQAGEDHLEGCRQVSREEF